MDWQTVRRDFPVATELAYLNSAAAGPVMRQAAHAATEFYREMMEEGDARWEEWLARREEVRATLARFINADADEIGLTTNTSMGMNIIVDALEGRGRVVSSELEFPVSTIPWMHRSMSIHFIKTREGAFDADDVGPRYERSTQALSL